MTSCSVRNTPRKPTAYWTLSLAGCTGMYCTATGASHRASRKAAIQFSTDSTSYTSPRHSPSSTDSARIAMTAQSSVAKPTS